MHRNQDDELVCSVNHVLSLISKYVILPVGLLCNLFLVSVFLSKSLRGLASSFYLILLTISNSLILSLLLTNILISDNFNNVSIISFLTYFDECLWEISAWLVALIAIDKVVYFSDKNKKLKSIPYNTVAATCLVAFSFLSNIMILFKTNIFLSKNISVYKYSYWFASSNSSVLRSLSTETIITSDVFSMAQFIKMIIFYFVLPFSITIVSFTIILYKIIRIKTSFLAYKVRDYKLILITILIILSFTIVNLPWIIILTDHLCKVITFLFNRNSSHSYENLFDSVDQMHLILLNIFLVLRNCYSIVTFLAVVLFNQLFRKEFVNTLKCVKISNCQVTDDNSNRNFMLHTFSRTYLVRIKKENIFKLNGIKLNC